MFLRISLAETLIEKFIRFIPDDPHLSPIITPQLQSMVNGEVNFL